MIFHDHRVAPVEDPVLLLTNLMEQGTLSASSETADGSAENAVDTFTYDFWTPNSVYAQIQSQVVDGNREYDSVAIAAHNLGSLGAAVRPFYSDLSLSRENKQTNSEEFTTGAWITNSPANAQVAPVPGGRFLGGSPIAKFVCLTTVSVTRRMYASTNISVTPNTGHWVSVYVAAKNWRYIGVTFAAGSALSEVAASAQVDLQNGAFVSQNGAFEVVALQKGWYRISALCVTGSSNAYRLSVSLLPGLGVIGAAAVGVIDAGVYVFGFHIEQADSAMGYVPRGTVSNVVNRVYTGEFYEPTDDAPIMMLYPLSVAVDGLGIEVAGAVASIGVLWVGKRTELACGVAPSYTPIYLSRDIDVIASRSRRGHFTGSRVIRRGASGSVQFTHMPSDYVQTELREFIDHYDDAKPFFFCPSPSMFPLDTSYCWRAPNARTLRPTFDDVGVFMSIGMEVEAVVQ